MSVIAYHFTGETLRDGSPIPPIGEWLAFKGEVVMCRSGLHASRDPFDALQYARGPILHKVECENIVDEQNDKFVCRRRKIILGFDATEMLRYFARMQALSVVHLWDAPDVVLDYLMTGDEGVRDAARAAAWAAVDAASGAASGAAAWAASESAARDAARAAAWAAVDAASGAASGDAAWAASGAAAWAAAWAAVDAASGAASGAAAWAASGAAAWAASESAARADFNALVTEQIDYIQSHA